MTNSEQQFQINSALGAFQGRIETGASIEDAIKWLKEETELIFSGTSVYENEVAFETEYQINEFNKIKSQYFDENGKAYTGTIFSLDMAEKMLKLINQLELERPNA